MHWYNNGGDDDDGDDGHGDDGDDGHGNGNDDDDDGDDDDDDDDETFPNQMLDAVPQAVEGVLPPDEVLSLTQSVSGVIYPPH